MSVDRILTPVLDTLGGEAKAALLDLAEQGVDELLAWLGAELRVAVTGKRPSKRRKGGDGTVAGALASRVMDGETGPAILRDLHPAGKP